MSAMTGARDSAHEGAAGAQRRRDRHPVPFVTRPRRKDRTGPGVPKRRGGPRSRGAVGVADVAGERGAGPRRSGCVSSRGARWMSGWLCASHSFRGEVRRWGGLTPRGIASDPAGIHSAKPRRLGSSLQPQRLGGDPDQLSQRRGVPPLAGDDRVRRRERRAIAGTTAIADSSASGSTPGLDGGAAGAHRPRRLCP